MKIPLNIPLYLFLISIAFFGFLFSIFLQQGISNSVFIIFLGIGGLILSSYILYVKLCDKPMICPTGSNCSKVIYSEYAKFFGIPLEYLGILYYAFIALLYSVLVFYPGLVPEVITFGTFIITSGAFLFSLYLTSIQAFALKQWCMWCLLSAVFSTTIFIVSFGSLSAGLSFLTNALPWLSTANFLALALGIGGVTLATILFFKFLKDFKISSSELGIIKTIFEIIWFSLAILMLTEFAIYLTSPEMFISSPQFLAKILVVAFIVLVSVVINLIILPVLTAINFDEIKNSAHKEFIRMRKITFGLGAIYITSWYFVFVIETLPTLSKEFPQLMIAYGIALTVWLIVSQVAGHLISDRTPNKQK